MAVERPRQHKPSIEIVWWCPAVFWRRHNAISGKRGWIWTGKSEAQYQSGNYEQADKTLDQLFWRGWWTQTVKPTISGQKSTQACLRNRPPRRIFWQLFEYRSLWRQCAPQTDQSLQQTKDEIASTYRGRQQYDEEMISLRKTPSNTILKPTTWAR